MSIHITDEAILEIVEKYTDMLYRISFVQARNVHDAEDLVQETLFRLLNFDSKFDNEEHLKAWLIRVNYNIWKDRSKSFWIKRVILTERQDGFQKSQPNESDYTEIREMVLSLPAIERNIILLHFYYGFNQKEISEIYGKSQSFVSTRIYRAKHKLRLENQKGGDL